MVSILGLARSPTYIKLQTLDNETFQYLGSRGAQHNPSTGKWPLTFRFNTWAREEPNVWIFNFAILGKLFQYLGSRGAQLPALRRILLSTGFNTWAREEPNSDPRRGGYKRNVSILGLARSPTCLQAELPSTFKFQYLGSRGAQPSAAPCSATHNGFNTWAREEPNVALISANSFDGVFQYLGSRGAQHGYSDRSKEQRGFNTWAREEPNRTP